MGWRSYRIAERRAGENFPPFHHWSRCTWDIVVDDWDKWIDDYVERNSGDGITLEKDTF